MSCNRIAACTASASLSKMKFPLEASCMIASLIRWKAPNECWKRVCCAPGYTTDDKPTCLIRVKRWQKGMPYDIVQKPLWYVDKSKYRIVYYLSFVSHKGVITLFALFPFAFVLPVLLFLRLLQIFLFYLHR